VFGFIIKKEKKLELKKQMKKLIKKLVSKSINEIYLVENVIDEDYPTSFDMDLFKNLKSFIERVKYCDKHLKKISSGSSRIVYIIDDTKVLKLAKNTKGIAQCETEINWGQDGYYGTILARTIDNHPDGLWVEMELARKIKIGDFKRIEGVDFNKLGAYLRIFNDENNGKRPYTFLNKEDREILENNEFVSLISSFMLDSDSPAGDLARLNSYGLVERDGQEQIVIIDFGLTGDIYDTYYGKRK
jgi:hypothetical protein